MLFSHFIICVVQMTSEWREIDFADADISLLGVTKITDVCYTLLVAASRLLNVCMCMCSWLCAAVFIYVGRIVLHCFVSYPPYTASTHWTAFMDCILNSSCSSFFVLVIFPLYFLVSCLRRTCRMMIKKM